MTQATKTQYLLSKAAWNEKTKRNRTLCEQNQNEIKTDPGKSTLGSNNEKLNEEKWKMNKTKMKHCFV